MTKVATSSAQKSYRISFVIRDGEHEYSDWLTVKGSEPPTPAEAVKHIILYFCDLAFEDDAESKSYVNNALNEYKDNDWFTLLYDYRIVSHVLVEPDTPRARDVLDTILNAWPQFGTEEPIPADEFLQWTTTTLIPYLAPHDVSPARLSK